MATWILIVEWMARGILAGLLILSIWSVAVILERRRFLNSLRQDGDADGIRGVIRTGDRQKLAAHCQSANSELARVLVPALKFESAQKFEEAVNSEVLSARASWEKGLPILGTLGATTPFVGLLGTILGIIVAFGALSAGQTDSLKVMYALAEALVLTAVGLAVAIPAVVANNIFTRKVLALTREIESLKDLAKAHLAKAE